MGKGKRQRERAERAEKRKAEKPVEFRATATLSWDESNDFNLKHGGIDPHLHRKPPPARAGTGYHWQGDILLNGMQQPVGHWKDGKLVPFS